MEYLIATLISAGVSLVIFILGWILKPIWETKFYLFKLKQEYRYDQQKKQKEVLSKYKVQLLNSCEELNFRLFNFTINYERFKMAEENYLSAGYYFRSFVYRFVSVFAWINIIDHNMVYLDTTIATKEDLEFLKFLRLFRRIITDSELFNGLDYDNGIQKDHFFNNVVDIMAEAVIVDSGDDSRVFRFSEFDNKFANLVDPLEPICRFIGCMSPVENRYRWDRVKILQIALSVFLNSYGYNFQRTPKQQIEKMMNVPRKLKVIPAFIHLIAVTDLDKQKEFRRIKGILNKNLGAVPFKSHY